MRLECTELVLKAGLDIQDEELSLKVLAEARHPSSDHQYLRLLLKCGQRVLQFTSNKMRVSNSQQQSETTKH